MHQARRTAQQRRSQAGFTLVELMVIVIICSYLSHKYFSFGAERRTGGPKGPSQGFPATTKD